MILPEPELEVVVRGLRRVYQLGRSEVHALQGIELDVARGQFVAVVGVSGSGKSTLLHLVGGLDTPTSGRIVVGGQEVAGCRRTREPCFAGKLWASCFNRSI